MPRWSLAGLEVRYSLRDCAGPRRCVVVAYIEKGATAAPFYVRARLAYRFLPAFFFPPLAFFAIVFYPPLHVGFSARALTSSFVAAAWHAHPMSALDASGHLAYRLRDAQGRARLSGRASLGVA